MVRAGVIHLHVWELFHVEHCGYSAAAMSQPLTATELDAFRAAVCRHMNYLRKCAAHMDCRGVGQSELCKLTIGAANALHNLQVVAHYDRCDLTTPGQTGRPIPPVTGPASPLPPRAEGPYTVPPKRRRR